MTTRAFTALALKLMGVFVLLAQVSVVVATLAQYVYLVRTMGGLSMAASEAPSLLPFFLAGLLATLTVIFILLGDTIAERLVPGDAPLPVVESMGADVLMAIGICSMGVLLVAGGSSGIVDWLIRFAAHRDTAMDGAFTEMMVGFRQFDIFEPVLRLGLGLGLMLAPRWVMRRLGLPR